MIASPAARTRWWPAPAWWAGLVPVLAIGVLADWAIAGAVLAVMFVQMVRPLDFIVSFLLLVAGGCFIANSGGALTFQLSLLTIGVIASLACYAIASGRDALAVPRTSMTLPLLLFCGLSVANMLRGFFAGHPPKHLFLESYPLLALGMTALVANVFQPRRDFRTVLIGTIVVAFAIGARGYWTFAHARWHDKGEYTVATPGIVGILLVNLALRARTRPASVGWLLLSLPLFIHQFLTFGRGLWTACAGGLIASLLIYTRFGPGSGARLRRATALFGSMVVLGALGAIVAAVALGDREALAEAGTRLTSIASTEGGIESRSNLIRFWEYTTVFRHVWQSPWIGHGIGFTFPLQEPFAGEKVHQFFVHQNFLLVWLKQGIVGLGLFVWLLVASTMLTARASAERADPRESAWLATAATTTCYLVVLSLSNAPFAVVNEMFLLALLWGSAMAFTGRGRLAIRWDA